MPSFEPLNDLEIALVEARGGRLPVQKLLHLMAAADLAVPSAGAVGADGSGFRPLLFPKERVQMLAVFTDKSRVGEYAEMTPYVLQMKGRDLLRRMPPDHGIVVNPGSAVGFDISPEGIAKLVQELA
jgi:hypothetical protein